MLLSHLVKKTVNTVSYLRPRRQAVGSEGIVGNGINLAVFQTMQTLWSIEYFKTAIDLIYIEIGLNNHNMTIRLESIFNEVWHSCNQLVGRGHALSLHH